MSSSALGVGCATASADASVGGGWAIGPLGGRTQVLAPVVATGGLEWPDEYARRMDFTAQVEDPVVRGVLAELARERVEVLDVGAGPTTSWAIACELLADRPEVSRPRDLYDGYEWICCVLRKRKVG